MGVDVNSDQLKLFFNKKLIIFSERKQKLTSAINLLVKTVSLLINLKSIKNL